VKFDPLRQAVLGETPGRAMKRDWRSKAWRSAAQLLLGGIGLALLTFVCFRLGLNLATTSFSFLILIALLSLMGGLFGSVVLSIIAVGTLNFFFTQPLFSLRMEYPQDILALIAFLTTSVIVSSLTAKLSKVAEELRQGEAQWREVFEHNPAMYFIIDPGGTVLSVNAFGAAQLGYTVNELVGQTVLNVFFEEDREVVQKHFSVCLANLGQSNSCEVRKIRKNGTVLWVRENAKALRRSDKQLNVLIVCEDITEHYEAGIELARLGSIVASSEDAIISKGLDGRITSWNAGATRIFGYQATEIIGQPITRIIPPELHAEEPEILTRLRRGERIESYETVRVAKDGRRIDMAVTVSPMFDKSGNLVGASKVGRDTTERQRRIEELRRSEAYLAEAQRISHTGSFGWNVATGEIAWSEETFRIFECDGALKPTMDLMLTRVHPDDRARVRQFLEHVSVNGEVLDFEHRLLMPGGSIKHLHVVAHAVKDASDKLEFVGAVMDITAIRRAEEELNQVRAELARVARVTTLGELTAAIAHEVNQPLTGLASSGNACLHWLSGETPNLQAARNSVERMINASNRAGEVISRIRAMVQKSSTSRDWLKINDTIFEVIALIRSEIQGNSILLRTELSNDVPLIYGDRIQLQQVILNLLMNAIEAMSAIGEHRELLVRSVKDDSNGVLVEVRDSGPGLDQTTLDRLFEAFYTTKTHGMGMGLAISRTIIATHGGRLWATPDSPRGAIFRFTLPTGEDEASS